MEGLLRLHGEVIKVHGAEYSLHSALKTRSFRIFLCHKHFRALELTVEGSTSFPQRLDYQIAMHTEKHRSDKAISGSEVRPCNQAWE